MAYLFACPPQALARACPPAPDGGHQKREVSGVPPPLARVGMRPSSGLLVWGFDLQRIWSCCVGTGQILPIPNKPLPNCPPCDAARHARACLSIAILLLPKTKKPGAFSATVLAGQRVARSNTLSSGVPATLQKMSFPTDLAIETWNNKRKPH